MAAAFAIWLTIDRATEAVAATVIQIPPTTAGGSIPYTNPESTQTDPAATLLGTLLLRDGAEPPRFIPRMR